MLSNRQNRTGEGFLIDPLLHFSKHVRELRVLAAGCIDENFDGGSGYNAGPQQGENNDWKQ
jgi:hypothetical protein